jgi:hypothetical protein
MFTEGIKKEALSFGSLAENVVKHFKGARKFFGSTAPDAVQKVREAGKAVAAAPKAATKSVASAPKQIASSSKAVATTGPKVPPEAGKLVPAAKASKAPRDFEHARWVDSEAQATKKPKTTEPPKPEPTKELSTPKTPTKWDEIKDAWKKATPGQKLTTGLATAATAKYTLGGNSDKDKD